MDQYEVVPNSEKMYPSFKSLVGSKFLIYFLISAFVLFLYSFRGDYYTYSYYGTRVVIGSIFGYFSLPFIVMVYEKRKLHYPKGQIFQSFIVNGFFSIVALYQIIALDNYYSYYYPYDTTPSLGMYGIWYVFIGFIILIYKSRNRIKAFFGRIYRKTKDLGHYSFVFAKSYGYQLTLIPFALEKLTIRKLSNNYRAVYFAKKFIILQAKPIKASLPGSLPSTISTSMRDIFENDIDRMHQLFKYNHITTYSKTATLKFVMKIADPIIKDLQLTLEQHLTEELLKENNNSKNLNIDVDALWHKIEKIMANWQSTFTESEFEYKDNLLVR